MPKWCQNDANMISKWSQDDPQMGPKWSQHDPKMIPTWSQNDPKVIPTWPQNEPKVIPKFSKDPSPYLLIDRSRCADNFGPGISLWDVLCVEFEPVLSFICNFWKRGGPAAASVNTMLFIENLVIKCYYYYLPMHFDHVLIVSVTYRLEI